MRDREDRRQGRESAAGRGRARQEGKSGGHVDGATGGAQLDRKPAGDRRRGTRAAPATSASREIDGAGGRGSGDVAGATEPSPEGKPAALLARGTGDVGLEGDRRRGGRGSGGVAGATKPSPEGKPAARNARGTDDVNTGRDRRSGGGGGGGDAGAAEPKAKTGKGGETATGWSAQDSNVKAFYRDLKSYSRYLRVHPRHGWRGASRTHRGEAIERTVSDGGASRSDLKRQGRTSTQRGIGVDGSETRGRSSATLDCRGRERSSSSGQEVEERPRSRPRPPARHTPICTDTNQYELLSRHTPERRFYHQRWWQISCTS